MNFFNEYDRHAESIDVHNKTRDCQRQTVAMQGGKHLPASGHSTIISIIASIHWKPVRLMSIDRSATTFALSCDRAVFIHSLACVRSSQFASRHGFVCNTTSRSRVVCIAHICPESKRNCVLNLVCSRVRCVWLLIEYHRVCCVQVQLKGGSLAFPMIPMAIWQKGSAYNTPTTQNQRQNS